MGKFPDVTEKSKISATEDFILETTNILNNLQGHNLTVKTKIIALANNFVSTTETFLNKMNRGISTDKIVNVTTPPATISPETLPIPQRQVVTFPAVQGPCRGNYTATVRENNKGSTFIRPPQNDQRRD